MSHPDTWARDEAGIAEPWARTTTTANERTTMAEPMTTEAYPGRRRADFGDDFPEAAAKAAAIAREARNASPILEALGYSRDRLNRLEHVLGDLNGVVMRLGSELEPVLTDGSYSEGPVDANVLAEPGEDVDRRSTVARNITSLGLYADQLADTTTAIRRRLEAILDAVEL